MKYRKALSEDLDKIYELIQELAINEGMLDEVEVSKDELSEMLFSTNPQMYCLVAEDKEIVGIATYYYKPSTWAGQILHLEDLVVSAEHRGSGVGKTLFLKLAEIAKQQKVGRMEWDLGVNNAKARDFYESQGAVVAEEWHICRLYRDALERL
ncbi:MAG: GNAT family N-acetyltransferase [Bacteroidales bacterium]